jgi:hypothetical protein
MSVRWILVEAQTVTYGHEIMDTRRIVTIIALLTLKAIRYEVMTPPIITPSHI